MASLSYNPNFSCISNNGILAIADIDALLVFLFKHYNSIEYQKLRVLMSQAPPLLFWRWRQNEKQHTLKTNEYQLYILFSCERRRKKKRRKNVRVEQNVWRREWNRWEEWITTEQNVSWPMDMTTNNIWACFIPLSWVYRNPKTTYNMKISKKLRFL